MEGLSVIAEEECVFIMTGYYVFSDDRAPSLTGRGGVGLPSRAARHAYGTRKGSEYGDYYFENGFPVCFHICVVFSV